jgi:bifunctional hydroxylase/dehydrase
MTTQVAIVGAGPAGLMLACELGLAGVETVVLEQLPETNKESVGMAINGSVAELLSFRGLMADLEEHAIEWPMAHFAHLLLDPTRLTEPYRYNMLLPQWRLESRLEQRAREVGVDVRREVTVTGLTQDKDGVTLHLADGDLRTAYVVGCDGADSVVREAAGIAFTGFSDPFHGIVGEMALEVNEENGLFEFLGMHEYPGGVFALAPTGEGHMRVIAGEFDRTAADPSAPPTDEELRDSIERLIGRRLDTGTPYWLRRWRNDTLQAEEYRSGRVFVAGDAAHVHFPLGGQALSTGVEDAFNLGWKLAADLNGWAPEGLLGTYHSERHPVGARACFTTRAQVSLLHPLPRMYPLRELISELFQYDDVTRHLVRMVGGYDVDYEIEGAPAHPLLGRRLADQPLTRGAEPTSLAELLTSGRGLVLAFGGKPDDVVAPWVDRVDVVHVEATPQLPASTLLVRPDARVVWAASGDDTAGLDDHLKRWFGEPTAAL